MAESGPLPCKRPLFPRVECTAGIFGGRTREVLTSSVNLYIFRALSRQVVGHMRDAFELSPIA